MAASSLNERGERERQTEGENGGVGKKFRRKEKRRGKARERERKRVREAETERERLWVHIPVNAEGTRRWVFISDLERKLTGRFCGFRSQLLSCNKIRGSRLKGGEDRRSRDTAHLSLVHLMVGLGSPTELQGRRTSFIQGVVWVPPKDRILAGAGGGGGGAKEIGGR